MKRTRRRWLVPEVLQTSLMDCGPAALKAVLDGHGLPVKYDYLRERCDTDVDGTSIDALARLGRELGLDSQRVLVSRDAFLLPESRCLPAIVVTRAAGGILHFIVVWSTWGPFVQIMDSSNGRRWLLRRRLLELMPDLPIPLGAARFRRWASGAGLPPLRARLAQLGLRAARIRGLLARAEQDPSWRGFGTLDAGVRMVAALVASGALARGRPSARLLESMLEGGDAATSIPKRFWWIVADAAAPERLWSRGSVIVQFSGRPAAAVARAATAGEKDPPPAVGRSAARVNEALPAELAVELEATELRPLRALWRILRFDAGPRLIWAFIGLLASALLVPLEALLLRSVLDIERHLAFGYQRAAGVAGVLVLALVGLWLDRLTASLLARMGSGLEARVRVAFLEKLPLLEDRYLQSRPSSDMANRGHALEAVREAPGLWAQAGEACLSLAATTGALLWLYPEGAPWTLSLGLGAVALPYFSRRSLLEANQRLRTHAAALDRFYLDALVGVSPIRVHGAEPAVQSEHEELLAEWARTARSVHRRATVTQVLQAGASTLLATALVLAYLRHTGQVTELLLLAYWALRVPVSALELVTAQLNLRGLGSRVLRVLSPLAAPDALPAEAIGSSAAVAPELGGVTLALERVSVRVGGQLLLQQIDLHVAAGTRLGIVGASGAGKSSLLGLLLGWLSVSEGRLCVDGESLDAERLARLRRQTAWVDPAIQLWDRSLFDNLAFDADAATLDALPRALAGADLLELLERLPEGMQHGLGAGGASVSGGQGQRVRFGRALMRQRARLVILDEPFRGLERDRRRELLATAHAHWSGATLLIASHDILDTQMLDRVIVLDAGRIVEDGAPQRLLADPDSRYSRLTRAAQALHSELWGAPHWRRCSIRDGRLQERTLV